MTNYTTLGVSKGIPAGLLGGAVGLGVGYVLASIFRFIA